MINEIVYEEIALSLLNEVEKGFQDYVQQFFSDNAEFDEHIRLKKEHTLRVCDEITALGESLGMNERQRAFARVMAILHDIGRFRQFKKYHTFADAESENHSMIAVDVINELGFNSLLSKRQNELLEKAILNHNIPAIPDNAEPDVLFYSRLLRDADKLDIWQVSIAMNIFHKIKNEPFPDHYHPPQQILECFENEQIILLKQVESYYDSILFRLSWVYDLYFPYTFKQFYRRNIAGKLLDKLPYFEKKADLKQKVIRFARSRAN